MNQEKIGHFLKELRHEKGITQEQLSEIVGVTNRSVSRWENGVNMPDFDLLIQIAEYFDVSIEEILNGQRRKENKHDTLDETMLKIADYNHHEQMVFSKRLHYFFIAGLVAFMIYILLDRQQLTMDKNIADFLLGLVLGVLILGALYTSRYMSKIRTAKRKWLHRKRDC